MSSCLALQIYTALVSVFFAWLFFRPRTPARRTKGAAPRIRRAPATVAPAAGGDEAEPFLDPETIAAWNSEFETRLIAPSVPAAAPAAVIAATSRVPASAPAPAATPAVAPPQPSPAGGPQRSRRSKPATGRSRAAARLAAARSARLRRALPRGGALSG